MKCDSCGREVTSTRVHGGTYHCQPCKGSLPRSPCTVCSAGIVHLPSETPTHCWRCDAAKDYLDRPCTRCGSLVTRTGVLVNGEAFCKRCRYHARELRQCFYCGGWHKTVHRSRVASLDQPACGNCIARHTPMCLVCRGKSRIVGTVEGLPACKACVNRGTLLRGTCETCGKVSDAPNTNRCFGCINLRIGRALVKQCESTIRTEWMRALFREFVEESGFHDKPGPVGRMIKRNIEAFRLIEQSVASPTDLTVSSVLIALDGDTNRRRYRVLKNWLALRMKLNFRGPEAAWIRHTTYINGVIESEEAEWIRKSLKDFLATIYVRREKLIQANSARTTGPKEIASINLAVNYALWFMRFCVESGAGSLPALNQELLERYASERPKVFQGLGAFVRYLNRTSHRLNQMTLPKKTRPASSLKNKIPSAKRSQLIRAFLNADTGADLRNSVIGLLALLYVRRVVQIIRLKLSDVRDSAGLLEINFGQGYWEIAPEVANLVRRWIDEWRAPSRFQVRNDAGYLFRKPPVTPH